MDVDKLRKALRLYVIPDRRLGAPLSLEEQARRVLAGGATSLQLRDKEAGGGELYATAQRVVVLCRRFGAACFVNDRLDVALACGADGAHLGQSDLPIAAARSVAPASFVIGASAGRVEEARRAVEDGADYLGVGAVFATGSKDDAKVIGLEALRAIREPVTAPLVATGGISNDNLRDALACGADGVAVISAAVRDEPEERARRLRETLAALEAL